ncbi:pyruvate formate-lyase-activating protein [Paenibacillus sp. N1-5-1-14]|uniref:pyruvate formate-lyase-activating protein n=1 Tax=Paenibacillus radicibacter TaxID=2972488 RepID=UPI002159A229|nr:pyruvate formate-lyase-activating protein [Paenibacillus radicibacter]MCR8642464.1 pyruvate formate-lyase-activating protein [Paenibacillus radicibacter]
MMEGRIHSVETFGTVDGPGIRFIIFLQGCALRCKFCHNPDTWATDEGRKVTVEEMVKEIEPYLPYYRSSGGGLTVSGGEPTLQAPFVTELFTEVKKRFNLHTTIDSSGFSDAEKNRSLYEVTDLVLLDLKMMDRNEHIELTSQPNDQILRTAKWLSDNGTKMWIRHVLIPGITDSEENLRATGEFLGTLKTVEKFEILPYHQMGIYKWEALGKEYPLEGVESPTEEEVKRAYAIIEDARALSAANSK